MYTSETSLLFRSSRLFYVSLLLLSALLAAPVPAKAQANVIVVSTTIQAAVDAANPGDTVHVPPGIYHENVLITKDNITIEGSPGAILDGIGLPGRSGITVRSLSPSVRLNRFRLTGMRIQNYAGNGVILIRVDNFQIDHGIYVNNEGYGIFPIRTSQGLIEFNQVSGSNDTGIYIGQSQDAVIQRNRVTDCTVGINVEVSSNITVQGNAVQGNTIGMLAAVLPGLSVTETKNIQIFGNLFSRNNRPNPVTNPTEFVSQLPSGVGLLIFGADNVTTTDNTVSGNNSAGIAVIQLPPALAVLDPRIDPFPDNDKVSQNVVLSNGSDPDPKIAPFPPSDLIWDLSGAGNCWSDNVYKTSFPLTLPDCP
ncbi:MAG TPA: parallel beta-helix domain-containing protein [Anaerolineales bacterium]|nr:parallel beta-helix domain-containing protein [Anaerolineales bacterium]